MPHRMISVFCLFLIMILCIGCSNNKDYAVDEIIDKKSSTEEYSYEKTTEKQTSLVETEKLEIPRTKAEFDDAFGEVDEQGNWTPPEGSYIDQQTGNIMNKDGVVVGTTQKPHAARPGSQG